MPASPVDSSLSFGILALLAGRNQALCLGCSGFRLSPPCDTSSKHWVCVWVCVVDDVEPSSFTICAAPPLRFLAVDSSSSLLRGCPSTLPLFSDLPSIGDRVICVWCLREVSVALGPPPDTCCTLFLALQVGRWRSPVTPAPPLPLGPFRFRPFPPFGFHLGSKAQPNRCHSDAGEREKGRSVAQGCLPLAVGTYEGRWCLSLAASSPPSLLPSLWVSSGCCSPASLVPQWQWRVHKGRDGWPSLV